VRKRKHDDHINHEAWAIPYADLMTLLLAFFVVMYAVSVVNEGKYRVMSESILEAFNGSSHVIAAMPKSRVAPHNIDPAIAAPPGQPGAATAPIAVPIPMHPSAMRIVDVRPRPHQKTAPSTSPQQAGARNATERSAGAQTKLAATQDAQKENLDRIRDQVKRAMQPLIDKKQVIVRSNPNWLEVEIRTDILFPSGVAQLSAPADQVLSSLAGILSPFSNPLRVEGYTDDRPINTAVYPSNWELSAARAASVARLFSEHGVSPNRMGIIGWGQFRPAADNATVDGRNRNRRVLVVVLSDSATPTRYSSDAEHAGELADSVAADTGGPGATAVASAPPEASTPVPAGRLIDAAAVAAGSQAAALAPAGHAAVGSVLPVIGTPIIVTPDTPR
jgi:chemotaxis protein MotB